MLHLIGSDVVHEGEPDSFFVPRKALIITVSLKSDIIQKSMDQQTKHLRLINYKKDSFELQKILNEWDFIGVFSTNQEWPKEEYNCLLDPILNSLYNNATNEELSVIIVKRISEHFGMDLKKSNVDHGIEKIMEWWESRDY